MVITSMIRSMFLPGSPGDGQQQRRGAQVDLVPGGDQVLGARLDLAGARVAGEARVGPPADLEPEPVSRAEAVRRTEQRDADHAVAGVRVGQPEDPVTDV